MNIKNNTFPCRICGKAVSAMIFGACETCAKEAIDNATSVQALRAIVSLWPDPETSAEIAPEWVGENGGKIRADLLKSALNTARKALGMPIYK